MSSLPRKLAAAFGIALAGATLFAQAHDARELYVQGSIWRHGIVATDVAVGPRGERSKDFVDAGREILTVSYATSVGARHTRKLTIRTLNTPIDDSRAPIVRYDAEAPESIALSWLQNVNTERWQAVVFSACLALGVIVLSVRLVR